MLVSVVIKFQRCCYIESSTPLNVKIKLEIKIIYKTPYLKFYNNFFVGFYVKS